MAQKALSILHGFKEEAQMVAAREDHTSMNLQALLPLFFAKRKMETAFFKYLKNNLESDFRYYCKTKKESLDF